MGFAGLWRDGTGLAGAKGQANNEKVNGKDVEMPYAFMDGKGKRSNSASRL